MIRRNDQKPAQSRASQPKGQPRRWPTFMLILICGLLLVSGFFFAGRQHFSSMDYGMKNSRLRKQIDDLEAEKRRLLLAREIAMSPSEVKKAAKKVGFTDNPVFGPELAKASASAKWDSARPAMVNTAASTTTKPMIVKTASVTAAPGPISLSNQKTIKNIKPVSVKRITTIAAE